MILDSHFEGQLWPQVSFPAHDMLPRSYLNLELHLSNGFGQTFTGNFDENKTWSDL